MGISAMAVFAVAVIALASLQAPAVSAQAANVLRVTPVRSDIQIQAGATGTVETVITNLTNNDITVKPIGNDFIAGDQSGTPALILDEDKFAPSHSLKRFMAPLGNITVPANESAIVNLVINVPADAQAGGYFGAIRFAPTIPDSGGQVNLSASVASLVLLTVPGDMVEKIKLNSFDIQQNGNVNSMFATPDNLGVVFSFENQGNIHIGPFGKVSVKQGDTVVYEADFNNKTPRDVILPDSSRRWEMPFENIGTFGYYTAVATFTYGSTNQTIEIEKSFWVIPPVFIIGAIVALVVLIGLIITIILVVRRRRRKPAFVRHNGRLRR